MPENLTIQEALDFNALQDLRLELRDLLPKAEADALAAVLNAKFSAAETPAKMRAAIHLSFNAVQPHEVARLRLTHILAESKTAPESTRSWSEENGADGYQPTPGGVQPVEPGPLLVCPVQGCQYQQYQLAKGEGYICKTHKKPLVKKEGAQ